MFIRKSATAYRCACTEHCRPGAWIRAVRGLCGQVANGTATRMGYMTDFSFRELHRQNFPVFVTLNGRDYAIVCKPDHVIFIVRGELEHCDTAIHEQRGHFRSSWPTKRQLTTLPSVNTRF